MNPRFNWTSPFLRIGHLVASAQTPPNTLKSDDR